MGKDVWRNDIERNAWVEKNCRVCFQPDEAIARVTGGPGVHGCPHLIRSLTNKLPTPWKKRRNAPMGETYKCEAFMDKPAVTRRGKTPADTLPMLDADPSDVEFVPVEGWPSAEDFGKAKKSKEADHQ